MNALPREVLRQGLVAHGSLFINATLSLINPNYMSAKFFTNAAAQNPELDSVILRLCQLSEEK